MLTFEVSLDDANGAVATNSYTLTVTPSASNSTVAVLSSTIQSGTSTTVTVTAEDAVGSPISGLTASDIVLTVGNGAAQGTFDPTSFASLGGGMYSETFTGTTAGTGNIIATIDGATILTMPSITVTPGVASGSTSTVSVLPGSIQAGNNTTVTVVAEDAAGNLLTGLMPSDFLFNLGGTGTSQGNFDPTRFANLGGGQYSETFTGTTAGTANTITVTIDGALVSTAPPITVTPGPVDLTQSTVSVAPTSISLGGVDQTTVTLTTRDSFGNQETNGGGAAVVFSVDPSSSASGTFSTPQDNGDGTFSASLTGSFAGNASFDATINGDPLLSIAPTLTVNAAPTLGAPSVEATAGQSYTATMPISGGTGPFIIAVNGLPSDLTPTISGSNVDITGSPTAADVGNYTVTIEDANGAQTSNNVAVNAAPTLGAPSVEATAGVSYSATMAISGGTGPSAFSQTGCPLT